MERGKRLHDVVSRNKLRLIPEISESAVFEHIEPAKSIWQNYFRVPLNDWLELSLVIDVLDKQNALVVDWKASVKRSTEHSKMQVYLYGLAMSKLPQPIDIKRGIYGTIDEDHNRNVFCREYSIFKINQEKKDLALNYAETIAGEIKEAIDNQTKGQNG